MEEKKDFTCMDCVHVCSYQPDVICYIWCSETERDFTFSGENTEPCELFEED